MADLKKGLSTAGEAALARSTKIVDQAQTKLEAVVAGPPQATPARLPRSRTQNTDRAGAVDPEAPLKANRSYTRPLLRRILRDAAVRHGLDPKLILALSYWESGWDQSRVSATGAVGVMQVEPASAEEAGPALLGRSVDLTDAYDNADIGAAIFREDLDHFKDPETALAAYYQGPTSLQRDGILPDTQQYVQGILDLASRIED